MTPETHPSGNSTVDAVAQMDKEGLLTGNLIPSQWFRTIKTPKGRTDYLAITVLSKIVYWHRPRRVYLHKSGAFQMRKRFREDWMYVKRHEWAEEFDCGKQDITNKLVFLTKLGVIEKRQVPYKNGTRIYIKLVVAKLRELTPAIERSDAEKVKKPVTSGSYSPQKPVTSESYRTYSTVPPHQVRSSPDSYDEDAKVLYEVGQGPTVGFSPQVSPNDDAGKALENDSDFEPEAPSDDELQLQYADAGLREILEPRLKRLKRLLRDENYADREDALDESTAIMDLLLKLYDKP